MKLIVSRRAAVQLREISDYIFAQSPVAARHVRNALEQSFQLLKTHPNAGRRVRLEIRRLVVTRYPYLIYYTTDETIDTLTILNVFHAARWRKL